MECVEKLIKKDMIHPLTSTKLKEKDIIPLQRVSLIVIFYTIFELTIFGFLHCFYRVELDILKQIQSLKEERLDQH